VSLVPYYQDEFCTIYHADIRERADLPDIACLVTSPPYNAGIDYGSVVDDAIPWESYRELAEATCRVGAKALISGGRAWVNVAPAVPIREEGAGSASFDCGRTRYSRRGSTSGTTSHGPRKAVDRARPGGHGKALHPRTSGASGK
jgi:hypothetical protein